MLTRTILELFILRGEILEILSYLEMGCFLPNLGWLEQCIENVKILFPGEIPSVRLSRVDG